MVEEKCVCCTCGYEWARGRDGSHSCAPRLLHRIKELETALKMFADYFDGDLVNVGGGTMIAPEMTMHPFKIAKQLLKQDEKMPEHQMRVIEERNELQAKLMALHGFICKGSVFETLDVSEQDRLREQANIMGQYDDILKARIDAF